MTGFNPALSIDLKEDGIIGPKTRKAIELFQQRYHCKIDGRLGPETSKKIAQIWKEHTGREPLIGKVPDNKYTPNYTKNILQRLK